MRSSPAPDGMQARERRRERKRACACARPPGRVCVCICVYGRWPAAAVLNHDCLDTASQATPQGRRRARNPRGAEALVGRAERRTPVEGKESVRCGTKGGTIREEGAAELSSQHCDSEVAGSVVWTPQASGARATIWPGCDAVAPTRPNATRWATPPWWRLTPLSPARAPPARTYTFCQ